MKIRNIITTSALVVLLGLTGGSAYAGDAGDNDILVLDSTTVGDANEVASTDFNEIPYSDK